jgi:uncharacterized protein (TIGR02266 family)
MGNGDDGRDDGERLSEPSQQDRRRFPRIQLALAVELHFPSAEAALESSTFDISEGGAFIHMTRPRPEGTSIELRLHLGDRVLELGGVVVRSVRPGEGEHPGIGVLFTNVRAEDMELVQSLVGEPVPT